MIPTWGAPAHPLAEHPLAGLPGRPQCSLPAWDRTYLTAVMLEGSLRECAPFVEGKLLDVGCGHRPYESTFFSEATEYVGVDYLSERSRPDAVCSALALPFRDGAFDTVASTEVLEHVPEPRVALREMQRYSSPAGA